MHKGYLSIVLHAHLPYVRHPEYSSFFEERWLFEALTECYIPLINVFDRLLRDGVPYRLTLSLSPTLMAMLCDELLQTRYLEHLHRLLDLTEKEITRTRKSPELQKLAKFYRHLFINALDTFQNRYACNLLTAFQKHQRAGRLELITCAATHGFLPLLSVNETAVRNQIILGIEAFKTHLGFYPPGFWLPECGYYPGLEEILGETSAKYFFVDTHGLTHAEDQPDRGIYAPLDCGNGVVAFARDPESSKQVWSSHEGYPGDFDYREYFCDIGFDLDLDYIAPYILDGNVRINTGVKYYRVTGGDAPKALYDPNQALHKAELHARDFLSKRKRQTDNLIPTMDCPPIIVAPYDAELFGHWWFEGPQWLESVLRSAGQDGNYLQTVSCSDYLNLVARHQVAKPSASTWGDQGYFAYWINESNDWIYPFLHKSGANMEKLAYDFCAVAPRSLHERALNQTARSLLLAQASDWPFIMKSGTTIDYARQRITDYLARFNYLHDSIRNGAIDERYLTALEIMDNIFPSIDFRDFIPTHLRSPPI